MSKKFLLLASFPDSIIQFRGAFIEALLDAGCEVHVAAPSLTTCSKVAPELEAKGVVCHDVPLARTGMNAVRDCYTLFALIRLMLLVRPHYVLGYTIKPVVYGLLAAWFVRVPRRFALITGLGRAFQVDSHGSLLQRVVRMLYRVALSRADKVFFQNPDDEALFRSLCIMSDRVPSRVVNGSGVDIDQFISAALPAEPLRFVMIARLIGDKGVREYVRAARVVRETNPDVCFSLVGWIDETPGAVDQSELEAWIHGGVIDFLGRRDDVRSVLADAHVYVLPSYREGTPRTVLEAMAMGRAIITTDAPGCRETVLEGKNGYLVPIKDAAALARAMLKFVESPSGVASMGKCSRTIAEDKYDVHKVNSVMLQEMGIS